MTTPKPSASPNDLELAQMLRDGRGRESVVRWLAEQEIQRRRPDPYAQWKGVVIGYDWTGTP